MKMLKFYSMIALISVLVGSLCACAALRTASPTAVPTLTPALSDINRQYLQVFEAVWSTVDQTYFDPEFGGVDWEAVHAQYEPLILASTDDGAFYQLLNQMLWELNVSHVGVGPKDVWPTIEPVAWARGKTGLDVRLLDGQAVITRVEASSPAEQAGLRPGYVIQSIDAASVEQILAGKQAHLAPPHNDQSRLDNLTRSLLGLIYGDPGTCVTLAYLDEQDALHEACVRRIQRPRISYMGGVMPPAYPEFESGILEDGIGYIRFNTFHTDLIPDMTEAVTQLRAAPGIIIDLRGNPGGDPTACESLAALFLDGQKPFGGFNTRAGVMEHSVTGKNIYSGPLVILIDALSFSGSEYFSSGMQALGRAVIIGERSPGGGTGMRVIDMPDGAILGSPVAQLITVDGRVLEGFGVIPDISVSLERSQLLEGFDAQLEAAINFIREGQ